MHMMAVLDGCGLCEHWLGYFSPFSGVETAPLGSTSGSR